MLSIEDNTYNCDVHDNDDENYNAIVTQIHGL